MDGDSSTPPNEPVAQAPLAVSQQPWATLPVPGQGTLSEADDRNWAMFTHVAAFLGLLVPTIGNILGPLVVWLIKRNESPFVDAHGKESLNFQISMSLYLLVGGGVSTAFAMVLSLLVCFGMVAVAILAVALSALAIFAIVYQILAAIRASEGGFLRYPLTIRFFR